MAAEILDYMVENPGAQDTLEGIVEWWLLENRIRRETRRVREALDELVALGLVTESGPPGARRYQVNAARWAEIVDIRNHLNEA